MLARLGRLIYRARWTVVVVWAVLFAVAALFAPRVSGVLRGGGYTIGNSESVVAYNKLRDVYGYRALTFTAVFAAAHRDREQLLPAARAFRRRATALYGRKLDIRPPVWSPDHAAVFERIYSAPQEDFGAGFAAGLRSRLPRSAVHGYLTGSAAVFHDMETVSDQDLRQIELVTLPIALAVLLLIFGSVVASLVPVLMAPISVSLALAAIYFLGHRVDMSIFVLNTTSMLGLGVAIDYSLFMVNRFRDELAAGRNDEEAVARTVATSGRAILVSALVVSVGFFGLTLSGVSMLSSLGIGGSIVTAFSLLVALTLLPAILGILGDRINRGRVVPARFTTRELWRRLAHWVMRRPIAVIGGVALVIVVLAWPAFHLRPGIPGPEILPPSVDSRAGNDILARHLGIANHAPVLVVVQRERGTPPSTFRSAGFELLNRVCSSRQVAGIATLPVPDSPHQIRSCSAVLNAALNPTPRQAAQIRRLAQQRRLVLISVLLRSNPSSAAAESYVGMLRRAPPIRGYQTWVGGQTAGQMDFNGYLYSRFPLVILFVTVTIFALLLIAFRSLLLPLKAVLMNVFSVLAAYGATVFAFQDGHLAGFLGFTPVDNVDSIVPVFLFCVLFGLSTDYEVFLLTRVQEEYGLTGDNEGSVALGMAVTGRIITSAAVVMIVVFSAFAFARLLVIKEVGLGLAVAVLVDATLIRGLLVPASMRLLGRWNWWLPGRGFGHRVPAEPLRSPGRTPAAE
jgi:RND superfamily putative drug exporter